MDKFWKAFEYPFEYINYNAEHYPHYNIENFALTMFDKNLKSESIDLNKLKFPKDITEVYEYQEGVNDEKPWHFVGKIRYKDEHKYVYYKAFADYTGFDCQGNMKLYVSKSLKRILKYAKD